MTEHNTPDYNIIGSGTVYLVESTNAAALENLQANVGDEAQWLGNNLAVEHRYIRPLVDQLLEEGWSVNWDETR